jgi:uncharacterized protein
VEVPAALWRKHRLGELSLANTAVLVEAFERDFSGDADEEPAFAVVAVGGGILDLAARSIARHPLRAYDAVQLATAVAARAADPELRAFACFDQRLAAAARAEGFELVV